MKRLGICVVFLIFIFSAFAQKDTLSRPIVNDSLAKVAEPIKDKKVDSVVKVHSPRKAIIRSALIPGWGQIYNKKYWKLPIVYGALGISGAVFVSNLEGYRDTRHAYKVKYNIRVYNDSAGYDDIDPSLLRYSEESLRFNRDEYRRYVDYSALIFLLLWGLNVVDAAVDAHLKSFDVSPDLSLQFKPGYSDIAGTNGISLVLKFK